MVLLPRLLSVYTLIGAAVSGRLCAATGCSTNIVEITTAGSSFFLLALPSRHAGAPLGVSPIAKIHTTACFNNKLLLASCATSLSLVRSLSVHRPSTDGLARRFLLLRLEGVGITSRGRAQVLKLAWASQVHWRAL